MQFVDADAARRFLEAIGYRWDISAYTWNLGISYAEIVDDGVNSVVIQWY